MTNSVIIRLRGHHLLCMLSYVGYGYSPAFTQKFDAAMAAINAGAMIEVVAGIDDLCATLDPTTQADYNCDLVRITDRDARALHSLNEVLSMNLQVGSQFHVTAEMLTTMRTGFKVGTIRKACEACEWHTICTDIANRHFEGVKLSNIEE